MNANDVAGFGFSYSENNNIATPKGANEAKIGSGSIATSAINKLHLIKLADDLPYSDANLTSDSRFQITKFSDLCKMDTNGAVQYDADDFLYCKNVGLPINRMITLRRFPYPCTDNIWDKEVQGEPDIARMVTYFSQETNKLDDLLSFGYSMRWKELNSAYEEASMEGEQSGLSGFMKKAMKVFDPNLYNNELMGNNAKMLNPTVDQNKVYGPVDSIVSTNIRDVGLDFNKEFDIVFEYELRSIHGRTPEYAMKDIIGNILACTYNNGKFWPGARFWMGERPSMYYERFQYMNTTDMNTILNQGFSDLKGVLSEFGDKSSSIEKLKGAITGAKAIALGKILDKVGRPGILTMNSLLSGEPTGFWHLAIGNPINPVLSIGNLICTGVDFKFPTDSLSYGDFPTKLQVNVKLKPGQAKDRAGVEMMFNLGKQRMYYAPKTVTVNNNNNINKETRNFFNFEPRAIDNMLEQSYDFISDGVSSITKTTQTSSSTTSKTGESLTTPTSTNNTILSDNAESLTD